MIIVRVELWSAVTGRVTELARMNIANVGGSDTKRNYKAVTYRGRSKDALDRAMRVAGITRKGEVFGHQSKALHVWYLVSRALRAMEYE